jgi:hypothetical protein
MENYDLKASDEFPDYSTASLETLRAELENFLETALYQLFIKTCQDTKEGILTATIRADLRGIESLFTREQLFGEASAWDKVPQAFEELHLSLMSVIKQRNKR